MSDSPTPSTLWPGGLGATTLARWAEANGFTVRPASDGQRWLSGDCPNVRFRWTAATPSPAFTQETQDDPLTIWVGDALDEAVLTPGSTDFFLDADALDGWDDPAHSADRAPGLDERLCVAQTDFLPSDAGDQAILTLDAPHLARSLRPGQFVNIAVSDGPRRPAYRIIEDASDTGPGDALNPAAHHLARVPLSMLRVFRDGSRIPSGVGPLPPQVAFRMRPARADRVSVALRAVGTATAALTRAREGDTLPVVGPLGQPERVPDGVRRVIMLAGGVGFAPLIALAEQCHWRGIPVLFLAGARVRTHLFPWPDAPNRFVEPELDDLNVELRAVSEEDDARYATDLLTDALYSVDGAETDLVYVCGPSPMMALAAARCEAVGVSCRVFLEKRMECGVGVCMSCVVPLRGDDGVWRNTRVCREGTVFDASRVRW